MIIALRMPCYWVSPCLRLNRVSFYRSNLLSIWAGSWPKPDWGLREQAPGPPLQPPNGRIFSFNDNAFLFYKCKKINGRSQIIAKRNIYLSLIITENHDRDYFCKKNFDLKNAFDPEQDGYYCPGHHVPRKWMILYQSGRFRDWDAEMLQKWWQKRESEIAARVWSSALDDMTAKVNDLIIKNRLLE